MAKKPETKEEMEVRYTALMNSYKEKIKKYENLFGTLSNVLDECSNRESAIKIVFQLGMIRERLRIEYMLIKKS